jgi:hypothetical protein
MLLGFPAIRFRTMKLCTPDALIRTRRPGTIESLSSTLPVTGGRIPLSLASVIATGFMAF